MVGNLVLISTLTAVLLSEPDPDASEATVSDLLTGYQQNRQQFIEAGFRVRSTQSITTDRRVHMLQQQQQLKAQLKASGLSAEDQKRLTAQLDQVRTTLESPSGIVQKSFIYRGQLWLRGATLQVQVASLTGDDVGSDFRFPDEPATTANLTGLYEKAHVLWFGGDPNEGVSVWLGQKRNGVYQASITSPADVKDEAIRFPPFAINELWPATQTHAVDQFFSAAEGNYTVFPAAESGNERTVKLQRRRELPQRSYLPEEYIEKWGPRIKGFEAQTADIDIAKGCLPTQIEWAYQWELDGAPFDGGADFAKVFRRVRDIQIESVDGLGYYPASGALEIMTRDPTYGGPQWTVGQVLERDKGAAPDIPVVIFQAESWKCTDVSRLPPDVQLGNVSFPDGTAYVDTRAQRTRYVGDEAQLLEQLTGAQTPGSGGPASQAQQRRTWRLVMIVLNIAVFATIVALWLRSKRTKQPN